MNNITELAQIAATVVADSISPQEHRITTMLLVMPRYLLSEFNTHRMFSRNSASSRAIPFQKMVESVKTNPFIPYRWMKEHKGMQGTEYHEHPAIIAALTEVWLEARDQAIIKANELSSLKTTKQMINRLLEPFLYHTVLVTATEWENFFALRFNEAADIHIQLLAAEMIFAMNTSTPQSLLPGEWHIPFKDEINDDNVIPLVADLAHEDPQQSLWDLVEPLFIKIATAKAAKTSYTLIGTETKDDYKKCIELHDILLTNGHMSPFEHCAQCPTIDEYDLSTHNSNLIGWMQYRKMLPNENRSDNRLIKKHYEPRKANS